MFSFRANLVPRLMAQKLKIIIIKRLTTHVLQYRDTNNKKTRSRILDSLLPAHFMIDDAAHRVYWVACVTDYSLISLTERRNVYSFLALLV